MKRKRRSVLFHHGKNLEVFKKRDLEILKKHFSVQKQGAIHPFKPLSFLKAFEKILKVDLVYSWFGSLSTFLTIILARLLGKKTVVVAGGIDVANLPEFDYGAMRNPISKIFSIGSFSFADKALAVSEYVKENIIELVPESSVEVVYNGVDTGEFKSTQERDKDLVLTVSAIDEERLELKGLYTFLKSASFLPDRDFMIIGLEESAIEELREISPENVELKKYIPNEEMSKWYNKSRVYVQISAHESFGVALAEAMACECVPVVTNRDAIPEVVGDTGFYVPYEDPKATADAIEKALKHPEKGKKARGRVVNNFTLEKREKKLIEIINRLLT